MPFTKVYIHFVFSTKHRIPHLDSRELRAFVGKHMRENAGSKSICIDHIGGYSEHCHCLVALRPEQSMSQVMHLVKGESAHWINKNRLCIRHFEWQDEYWAASVSDIKLTLIRRYIQGQEKHHQRRNFAKEFEGFVKKLGFHSYPFPLPQASACGLRQPGGIPPTKPGKP